MKGDPVPWLVGSLALRESAWGLVSLESASGLGPWELASTGVTWEPGALRVTWGWCVPGSGRRLGLTSSFAHSMGILLWGFREV